MSSYNLTIQVADEEKLATIISALAGSGTILSLSATGKRPSNSQRESGDD